jgi:hypothetical protein
MKKSYAIVQILWLDAEAAGEWQTEQQILNDDVGGLCTTVGFLVKKPTKKVPMYFVSATVAAMDKEVHFNNTMKIPSAWVKTVNVLQEEYKVIDEND